MKKIQCNECGSLNVHYDGNHGFYECQHCGEIWGYDQDDPDYDECEEDFGACCACGSTGPMVRNFVTIQRKAPVPGTGWGCMICRLPPNGAVAIVCDSCLHTPVKITSVVHGYPMDKKRVSIDALTESFKHKNIPHDE